jgi:Na+/proline symporter
VIGFFAVSLVVGLIVARRAGRSISEYFLSGRNMPWVLLGVSMVATTFSTDTPNLVTDIVRNNGVAGNWVWWAFLLTGMLTVFVYANLWRRSGVVTDIEFYELRYSGKAAAFLRGFRALYLGVFFNVLIMASVTLAAIKIGGVMLGLTPIQTVLIAAIVVVIYSTLGGLRGVLITDLLQFSMAMIGAVAAAIVALNRPEVGGLGGMLSSEALQDKLSILPDFSNTALLVTVFIIPLAVQWWSVWYPGSEPGGGGYVAQRMLAARNENDSIKSTFLFQAAHYALRPWPWIIVALCSLIVFPNLASLQSAFPSVDPQVLKDDLAYPAMLTFLPAGLLGLVVTSLIAAYMSTISTHLNWGSSYVVNDFYKRFVKTEAGEKELVLVGRLSTAALMVLACVFSLLLSNALQTFQIMLQVGAGTGLLFILRWFWWRINPWSEITAMVVSFLVAVYFQFLHMPLTGIELADWHKLLIGVGITTVAWVGVTLLTAPVDDRTLRSFFRLVRPPGPGWNTVLRRAESDGERIEVTGVKGVLPLGILCMVLGCLAVYGALFAIGSFIYGSYVSAVILTVVTIAAVAGLVVAWPMLRESQRR